MPTTPDPRIEIEVDTSALERDFARVRLTVWAQYADQYDEWHRDAALLFQRLNHPAQDRDHALAALAHWAERADRYESPHREAAEAFWTWYEGEIITRAHQRRAAAHRKLS